LTEYSLLFGHYSTEIIKILHTVLHAAVKNGDRLAPRPAKLDLTICDWKRFHNSVGTREKGDRCLFSLTFPGAAGKSQAGIIPMPDVEGLAELIAY
jgi:hypothetical protein